MSYQKKRMLSCIVVLLFVLLAYICRFIETDNELIQTLADQCRTCTYLGIYCAWVIYLNKHVVQKKMRQYLTAVGCLMVCWFFLRTVKYHILLDPLGGHICWYLYYIPMILIPTFGLSATLLMDGEEKKTTKWITGILLFFSVILIICVLTNDLHQQVFRFEGPIPYSDKNYGYGILFMLIQLWIIACLVIMEILLVKKSRIPDRKRFWLPVIPGLLLLGWNIANLLGLPFIKTFAGDMTAICCLLMAAIFRCVSFVD